MNPIGAAHQPPRTLYALLEFGRAVQELLSLAPASTQLSRLPRGDGHPVMTIPGFGGADGSTALLRRHIARWGYASFSLWSAEQEQVERAAAPASSSIWRGSPPAPGSPYPA